MKDLSRTVLLAALAEYACYPPSQECEVEANRLHAVVAAITPDVVPVPDGEEIEVMMTRFLAKFGVDAFRLSCAVALQGYTTAPQHLDEGAEGAKSRNLALRLSLAAQDSARYERLVEAGVDSTIPGIDTGDPIVVTKFGDGQAVLEAAGRTVTVTGNNMAMSIRGVVDRTNTMFPLLPAELRVEIEDDANRPRTIYEGGKTGLLDQKEAAA